MFVWKPLQQKAPYTEYDCFELLTVQCFRNRSTEYNYYHMLLQAVHIEMFWANLEQNLIYKFTKGKENGEAKLINKSLDSGVDGQVNGNIYRFI